MSFYLEKIEFLSGSPSECPSRAGCFLLFPRCSNVLHDISAKFFHPENLKCIWNVLFLYLQMYLFLYWRELAGTIELLHNYPGILRRNVTTSGQICIYFHSNELCSPWYHGNVSIFNIQSSHSWFVEMHIFVLILPSILLKSQKIVLEKSNF